MISVKSPREIELMRQAGKIVGECHDLIRSMIKPGITSQEINDAVEAHILACGATPEFKGYGGFPAATCCSVNDTVVHGFPNNYPLKAGDIISVDIGARYKGYVGDSAWTYQVGEVSEDVNNLLEQTQEALFTGLDQVKAGVHLSDVSHAVEEVANRYHLGIVRNFAGHGVGSELHEEPEILNYGPAGKGPILQAGMTLAIEPMLNLGTDDVYVCDNGWEVKTNDHKPAAHFEHTILVTEDGYEILTKQNQ